MAKKVGTLIKEARTAAGLTQEALAKKIKGVSASDMKVSLPDPELQVMVICPVRETWSAPCLDLSGICWDSRIDVSARQPI